MGRRMNKDNQNLPVHAALHNSGPDPQKPSHLRARFLRDILRESYSRYIYIYIYINTDLYIYI